MRKHLNNPYIVGAMLVAAAVLIWSSLGTNKRSQRVRVNEPIPEAITSQTAEIEMSVGTMDLDKVLELASSDLDRNPFSRENVVIQEIEVAEVEERKSDSITMGATYLQGEQRFASVDGIILLENDTHKHLVMESISADGAWFRLDGQRKFIRPGQSWHYQYDD